jgi:monoterpene epsilon-lactone hydrolase
MNILDRLALWEARYVKKPVLWAVRNGPLLRPLFAASVRATARVPRKVAITQEVLGGVPGRKIWPGGGSDGVLLYLHGGGFVIGGSVSHLPLAARLAQASGLTVYLPDYRLAPEHPFPAAPDDCFAAYRALLDTVPADKIAVAGDSAGGCLTLALLHQCTAEGVPLPGAIALLSPVGDLTVEAQSTLMDGPPDALLSKAWGKWAIDGYMGAADRSDPRASPLLTAFTDPPPAILHYADDESLADQNEAIAGALRAGGGSAEVETFKGTFHAFQIGGLPLAGRSIMQIGALLKARVG